MSISFSQYTNVFNINYYVPYIIGFIWIFIAILKYLITRGEVINKSIIKFYLKIFIMPWIIFVIHNSILYISNPEGMYLKTAVNGFLVMFITILSACAAIYIFKEKTYRYAMISIIISFGMVIIKNVYLYGLPIIWRVIYKSLFTDDQFINPFEVSDITFAVAIVILTLSISYLKTSKEDRVYIVICWFIIIIGFKRIQFLALAIIFIVIFIFKRIRKRKNILRLEKLIGICVIIIGLLYVYSIDSGILNNIINLYNINTMGRINMYTFISRYYDFNILFKGLGYGFTLKKLSEFGFLYVLHSDILRFYVEFGFIVFVWWLWYSLIYSSKRIAKKVSVNDSVSYFIVTLYLFILHFTDNTTNYFVTQYLYVILAISMAIIKKKVSLTLKDV